MCYDTDSIHGPLLLKVVDLFNRHERVTLVADAFSVWFFLDDWISIEHKTVIVLDACVLLICNFDISTWEQVDFSFLQLLVPLISDFVKESRYYLCVIRVDELHVEQFSLSFSVLPRFQLVLLCHTCLYFPVKIEGVQWLYWRVLSVLDIDWCNNLLNMSSDLSRRRSLFNFLDNFRLCLSLYFTDRFTDRFLGQFICLSMDYTHVYWRLKVSAVIEALFTVARGADGIREPRENSLWGLPEN